MTDALEASTSPDHSLIRRKASRGGHQSRQRAPKEPGLAGQHTHDCVIVDPAGPHLDGVDVGRGLRSRPELAATAVAVQTGTGQLWPLPLPLPLPSVWRRPTGAGHGVFTAEQRVAYQRTADRLTRPAVEVLQN